jgi:hypothetical protein
MKNFLKGQKVQWTLGDLSPWIKQLGPEFLGENSPLCFNTVICSI